MIRGAWMCRREDDAVLKICCAPKQSDKPCADSERVQKWRMSLASLLFFTVLLSDHLWLCAGVKLRSRERSPRRAWPNGTDGAPADLAGDKCGGFLGNLTRCTDHQSRARLESACAALHRQRSAAASPQMFLDYFRNLSLAFCDAYSVSDLLQGMARPDGLNCSLANVIRDLFGGGEGDGDVCSACVQAYVRLDQHAQEKYEEFDLLFLKYLSEDYSVRSRTEHCKAMYKAWLCSEYFPASQRQCLHRIPCKQYCLEVQTSCPFVLPDNAHLVYGGLSSFICTGLLEDPVTGGGPECCDVRWSGCDPAVGAACALTKLQGSSSWQRRSWQAVSCASRLCSGRLKLCVLVLILLHTVVSITTVSDSNTGLDAIVTLEESPTREE
ncbi:NALCN channel auxiliary factor 2 [Denticeps clupeoides]|uniref:Transmembrane protein FAM155B n=1 Tax=Denticeps clupeoides TaxID=299321 RepID=A0AAY4EPB5_9TELE|nr:transmembrane protein FAM155B [Denticeps clupeoides]